MAIYAPYGAQNQPGWSSRPEYQLAHLEIDPKLQKYIDKFEGQEINGILVTESGLLAAAHLGGQGSVKKWFRTGKVRSDGNGVKITSYMIRFGGYNLDL